MTRSINFWEAVERIRAGDDRFKPGVYPFIMEGLDFTIEQIGERRHVSAEELLDGLCGYARDRFGFLAHDVLTNWGVATPFDIGVAVFQLVDAGVLSKRDNDDREDFNVEYDLRQTLEDQYFE